MKDFDEWNKVKKEVDKRTNTINVKNREIYWASIGENIGSEQNGKGQSFSRPILIVQKLNKELFLGVPLSTKTKDGSFFYNFNLNNIQSNALLVQVKVYDVKRLDSKVSVISKVEEIT
ncbi:type II toxin-antitoxin system PemK/MazF family toxin [Poseidonibacter ostreae]|nr:type II toxin-antitoxin system PemK/MazF family toxin [Poseidonibacter ostreae]